MSINPSGRFGLFEIIVVVTLVGVLAAAGVKYYGQLIDESRRVSLVSQARAFTAVVAQVHWSWVVKGVNVEQESKYRDGSVVIDTMRLYVNRFGWPTHSDSGLSKTSLSAVGCKQVWELIMQNPGSVYVKPAAGLRPDGLIYVSVIGGSACRYEMLSPSKILHYFDYNVINGRVDVVTGR